MEISEKQKKLFFEFCNFINSDHEYNTSNISYVLPNSYFIDIYSNNNLIGYIFIEIKNNITQGAIINYYGNSYSVSDVNNDRIIVTNKWHAFLRKKKLNILKNGTTTK